MDKRLLTVEFDKDEVIAALAFEFSPQFSDNDINYEDSWITLDPDTGIIVVHYIVGG